MAINRQNWNKVYLGNIKSFNDVVNILAALGISFNLSRNATRTVPNDNNILIIDDIATFQEDVDLDD